VLALILVTDSFRCLAPPAENGISTTAGHSPKLDRINLKKRNALQWGLAAGTNQWRFVGMAAPMAPLLYYYAGIPSVASYYWDKTRPAGRRKRPMLADAASQRTGTRPGHRPGAAAITHVATV
jgi:hypothetical protein